jgi:hypothetical protein
MWNTVVYLTFHETAVRLHFLRVNIRLMYLASKQVVDRCFHCVSIACHVCNSMVTTRARHSANQVMVQQDDDSINKSPVAKKKVVIKHPRYRCNTPCSHTHAGYPGGTAMSSTKCVSTWT